MCVIREIEEERSNAVQEERNEALRRAGGGFFLAQMVGRRERERERKRKGKERWKWSFGKNGKFMRKLHFQFPFLISFPVLLSLSLPFASSSFPFPSPSPSDLLFALKYSMKERYRNSPGSWGRTLCMWFFSSEIITLKPNLDQKVTTHWQILYRLMSSVLWV